MDKRSLRVQLRAARDAVERVALPFPPPFAHRLTPNTIVAAYLPIGSEADPAPLVRAARARGCPVALPHVVDRATPLRFVAWEEEIALTAGPFGLTQPPADAADCSPDIVLTPLVGFDRRGHRLGQGAGHYDRAFAAYPHAWRIGVALAVQEIEAIPADPWDVPLHAIVTEREWITP